jgi:hypothetical protein
MIIITRVWRQRLALFLGPILLCLQLYSVNRWHFCHVRIFHLNKEKHNSAYYYYYCCYCCCCCCCCCCCKYRSPLLWSVASVSSLGLCTSRCCSSLPCNITHDYLKICRVGEILLMLVHITKCWFPTWELLFSPCTGPVLWGCQMQVCLSKSFCCKWNTDQPEALYRKCTSK